MRGKLSLLIIASALVAGGCEEVSPPPPSEQPAVEQTAPEQAAPQQPESAQDAAPQRVVAPGTTIVEGSAQRPQAGMVRETARQGMGKKGRGYGGGIITQPISTYFQTQDRITFMQIPHSMNNYKALNGRYPKDLDEFMDEIIKPAGLQLPELPEGHRYVYDPEKGELLVERPR